jgi:hypothetical protein
MNDENLHITPDPHKGIPEPEIPADEAWNNMAAMLDAEMPVAPPDSGPTQKPPSTGGGGILGGSIQFWSVGLIVLGVAGLVTWGVLRLTNKPETTGIKQDRIDLIRQKTITDSVPAIHQSNPAFTGNIRSAANESTHGIAKDLPQKHSDGDSTVRSKAISKPANIAGNEQHPALTSLVSKPSETNTKDILPSKTVTDSLTATDNRTSGQKPVIEEKSKDTVKLAEVHSVTASGGAESVKSNNTVPVVNPDVKSPTEMKADNTRNNSGSEKPKNPLRMSDNLSWQLGVSGNIGEVVQKGRNPNLYYGAMVTGGLWHKKLKAGIETGIGWTAYNDYGSVSNNVRIMDSIPGDTVHPATYTDTTRISSSRYRYQYLQIPLFISKQIVGKGSFVFNIKTGPAIGFLISQKQLSNSTSGPESGEILRSVNNDYTRLKTSWQWHLMVELQWNLSDKLSFTVCPSGIFYMTNLYDRNNRPPSIPFGIGVNVGLIYKFK